ncbi:hypothetical protein JL721_7902 [Aureococcus anophagefferens]|nr:hypothetical protein JL721_7902 [Aureococcus anophagefferens]
MKLLLILAAATPLAALNMITYNGAYYSTIHNADPYSTAAVCGREYTAVPSGWAIATYSSDLYNNVINAYPWNTHVMGVLSASDPTVGEYYGTSNYATFFASPSAGPSPLPSAAPSACPSASPSAGPSPLPTASFVEIASIGESACIHGIECELLWVYRGDSSACATLTAVFTDPDGTVILTESLDNDGQETHIVSGDAAVSEYADAHVQRRHVDRLRRFPGVVHGRADGRAVEPAQRDAVGSAERGAVLIPSSTPAVPTPAPTRDTVSLEIALYTQTADASYATAEDYCDDYYSARIDQIEEAVVYDYVDEMIAQSGSSANSVDSIASIEAMLPNGTNATDPEAVTALFSIRFTARVVTLSRDDGSTLYTVKEALNAFFQSKVDSGDWASDRIAQTTDDSWTSGSQRRLEESAAAQDFISPQSVVSVETTILVAAFDGPTDKASATTGARFPCAEVLDFDGADRATCYWIDARSVNADVASAAVVPGGNVTLAAGAVRRACDAGAERCDCDRPANASSAPAAPPDPPLVPVALLDGPTTAAVCEGVVVGSSQSTGSGGRPFAYAWNATLVLRDDWVPSANTTNATLAARAAVAAVLAAANAGAGSPMLAASSDDLIAMAAGGAAGLEVSLVLSNFLGGASAPSDLFPVAIRTDTPPNLEIVGGVVQSATRPKALSVRANALATGCDGRPMGDRAVTIAWALSASPRTGASAGLASTSGPALLQAPALQPRRGVGLRARGDGGGRDRGHERDVDGGAGRGPRGVVAIVLGGACSLAGAVELDASESYDEDVDGAYGADAGLTFAWSCDDPACDARAARRGVFAVNVTSPDGRSAAAAVVYELVDDDPPAVEVDAWTSSVGTRVAASKKIVLYGDAQPSSLGRAVSTSRTFNTTWVLERGTLADEAPLAVWARTAPALSGYARDREHDLVLAVGAIVAGAHYSLRLDATLEGTDTAGSASVTFYVARPPSSGRLLASPAAGFALETTFELSTRSWVTEDPPLTYAFKSRTNGSESTLRGPTLEAKLGGVVLPMGSPNVTLVVVAADALGGSTEAPLSLRTSSALLSVASDGSGLAVAAASSALDSCEGLAAASGGDTGITAVAARASATRCRASSTALFAAGNGSSNASAGASLGSSVDGILAAQLAGAVAGEYAMTLSSPNLKSSAPEPQRDDARRAPGAAAPTDFSTEDEATDAGSVYFKNLTEPPDLSRALIMIYALLALLGACVAAHAYGRRLDARDAAAARAASAVAAASDADDDPYEVNDDHDVLTAGWKQNFLTGMDLGHPFYGWYTLYSASVPRPFRAWCCGFEILVFMYALAFETNLLFPDVEEECAGKLNPETCASLKTVLRGKFKGTHVESAPLCQWMPCAEACVMEEPGEDEMSPMSAARRPERGPTRRDNGRARRPVCKIFAYLAENYLVAPVPWRCGEPPIPTLKIDWHETGAPEASPGTLASSAGPESAVADDELLRKLRAAVEEPGGAAPAAAGDPDKEPLEILEIKERPDGGEARARVDALLAARARAEINHRSEELASKPSMTRTWKSGLIFDSKQAHELLEGGPPDARESQAPIPEGGAADGDATGFTVSCSVQCDGAACVAPVDAGAACLSSTLDDAFAVPSMTAACLFGLDRRGRGPARGQGTIAALRSSASFATRGVSRVSFAARRATSRRTLCSDSSKTTLEAADDARAKERAAVAYLRAEMLSKKERTVMTTIAERLQGELEAPEEPPGAAPYIAAWAGVLCVVLYCFYYLLTTGSQFGRKKTRLWLEAVTFSLVLYFVFIKPIVILLISVIMPSFVASSVDKTRSPSTTRATPSRRRPESSVFYLLRWHPELNGTRLADHVAAEATGAPRSARECLTDVRVAEIHGAAIPRTSGTAVVLALIALLFGLHEDIQDTLIEEVFTFLPLASGFVAERTPGLESAGRTSAQPSVCLRRSDYVFSVQAKPEDAPVPSYSDAAYAAVFGAAAAARDDHDAGDAVAARPGEARSRAGGRSATQGEGRSRSGSRSKSRSRSRSRRPGRRVMHRAPYVVKAKGAVVRAGVASTATKS